MNLVQLCIAPLYVTKYWSSGTCDREDYISSRKAFDTGHSLEQSRFSIFRKKMYGLLHTDGPRGAADPGLVIDSEPAIEPEREWNNAMTSQEKEWREKTTSKWDM